MSAFSFASQSVSISTRNASSAPYLIDGGSNGRRDFHRLIRTIGQGSLENASLVEANRLFPYFNSLATVLASDLADNSRVTCNNTARTIQALQRPGQLAHLFDTMSAATGGVILNRMTLMPYDIFQDLLKKSSPNAHVSIFAKHFPIGGRWTYQGFMQVPTEDGSISLPFTTIDSRCNKLMRASTSGVPFLTRLSVLLSTASHDTIHHLTKLCVTPIVSRNDLAASRGDNLQEHSQSLFLFEADEHPLSYESWCILTHARVMKALLAPPAEQAEFEGLVDDMLNHIDQMAACYRTNKRRAHDVVDYAGSLMLFALEHLLPLDHPLILKAVERMEAADPLSEPPCREQLFARRRIRENPIFDEHPDNSLKALKLRLRKLYHNAVPARWLVDKTPARQIHSVVADNPRKQDIVSAFRPQGLHLLADPDTPLTYAQMKLCEQLLGTGQFSYLNAPIDGVRTPARSARDQRARIGLRLFALMRDTLPNVRPL